MEDGDLKTRLIDACMQSSSSSTSRSGKKLMFVDASYERNTRIYLRQKQEDKVRALTLGEVSREIHCMKT